MILDRIQGLREDMAKLKRLGKNKDQLKDFNHRLVEFQALSAELRTLVDNWKTYRQSGLAVESYDDRVKAAQERVTTIRNEIARDPSWLLTDYSAQSHAFNQAMRGLSGALKNDLTKSWADHTAKQVPTGNQATLEAFRRIKGFSAVTTEVTKRIAAVEDQRKRTPKTKGEIEAFEAAVDELKRAWKGLVSEDDPPEVQAFLSAATGGGAPLALLTPAVRDWLENRKLIDAVRIKLE